MNGSFKIAKIFGIEIKIHYSWLFIFALVYFSLAWTAFPEMYKGLTSLTYQVMAVFASILLFASVLFHEVFHAYVGNKNHVPIKSIVLFIFGGVSQIEEEPRTAKTELKMAIAGPLSSLFLSGLFLALSLLPQPLYLKGIFDYLWQINITLTTFNLIPAFPLDGGRVLRAFVWLKDKNIYKATQKSLIVSRFFSYLFIVLGLLIAISVSLISGIWLGVIGWFLFSAATNSYDQLVVKRALEKTNILSVISKKILFVKPKELVMITINKAIKNKLQDIPIIDKNEFYGVAELSSLIKIKNKKLKTVQEDMIPAISLFRLNTSDNAYTALKQMLRLGVNLLPVYSGNVLKGVVTKDSIIFLINFGK